MANLHPDSRSQFVDAVYRTSIADIDYSEPMCLSTHAFMLHVLNPCVYVSMCLCYIYLDRVCLYNLFRRHVLLLFRTHVFVLRLFRMHVFVLLLMTPHMFVLTLTTHVFV
jgi:hypothetical protein